MKKLITSTTFILYFTLSFAQGPSLTWAKQTGGSDYDHGKTIFTDHDGNVYTAGQFQGTVDFDPSSAIHEFSSEGLNDIFITKFSSTGDFIWAKQIGGTHNEAITSVTVDENENVYATGSFHQTTDFDPGNNSFNLTTPSNSSDIFVLKLDINGDFVWAKQIGGLSQDIGTSLTTDGLGNLVLTGLFGGTVDFDPGSGTAELTSSGSPNTFVLKLDSNGNYIWAKAIKSVNWSDSNRGTSVSIDNADNIFLTGNFKGVVDCDPDDVSSLTYTSQGGFDIFITKLNSDGNLLWAKQIGGNTDDKVEASITDDSGNIYATGEFRGTVDFDPGSNVQNLNSSGNSDIFVLKLSDSGDFIWSKNMGGSLKDKGKSISIDQNENIYTTGFFNGTADFNPGSGTAELTSEGFSDIFISKLNNSGDFLWAQKFGEEFDDSGNSIFVDSLGYIYVTGEFQGTVDFDPETTIHNLDSEGIYDIFILKMASSIVSIENNEKESISIYPNPTKDIVYLSGDYIGGMLLDMNGRKIQMLNEKDNFLDITNLRNGVYLLKLNTQRGIITSKIVKK